MSHRKRFLQRYIPASTWLGIYNKDIFKADLIAGIVVTIMLIPQSLAYAMLAGMPAETGLYASILPLVVYAIFGSSRTLSVGPVAIVSLMTMASLADVAQAQTADYISAAITLAMLSGVFLFVMGLLNFGFVANHLLGIDASGHNLFQLVSSLLSQLDTTNFYTASIGLLVLMVLFWSRQQATTLLVRIGISADNAKLLTKSVPVLCIIFSILLVMFLNLEVQGVAIVGEIPSGLPNLQMPVISITLIDQLWIPALTISLIGYVESVSVGKTLASKRRERIDSNQELISLGASNMASAISGGFPVTGGLSRSVVNFDAGAVTPAAGVYAAIGIALASLFLAPAIYFLPKATLAATIVVAVLTLIDTKILAKTWLYSKTDFVAVLATIVGTLALGVEIGVAIGISLSLLLHLYRNIHST